MLESEKLAIAAHLHVVMRRKIGRVTDVEWMVRNADYAREVIRLALAEVAHPELLEWGQRFMAAMFPSALPPATSTNRTDAELDRDPPSGFSPSRLERGAPPAAAPRYVGRLR